MTESARAPTARLEQSVSQGKTIAEQGGSPLGKTQEPAMVRATATPTDGAFRVFKGLLDADGLRYALYSLLRLTDYRYLSVFRFEAGSIRSLAHVDREDLSVLETGAAPESASYCCYVRTEDGPFVVVDAAVDPRVDGHAKQQDLRAYCGLPIIGADGQLLGTLCHYDAVPRDPAQLNAELLTLVVGEIVRARLLE